MGSGLSEHPIVQASKHIWLGRSGDAMQKRETHRNYLWQILWFDAFPSRFNTFPIIPLNLLLRMFIFGFSNKLRCQKRSKYPWQRRDRSGVMPPRHSSHEPTTKMESPQHVSDVSERTWLSKHRRYLHQPPISMARCWRISWQITCVDTC